MKLTRRDVSRLAIGTALSVSATPAVAFFHRRTDWAALLASDMNEALGRGCAGKFTVIDFVHAPGEGLHSMMAVVQLDWPPGERRRRFVRDGGTGEMAYKALKAEVLGYFGGTWPGCVA